MFIATSLDGFIAREDGSIDWLERANASLPAGEDCGYKAFFASVDVLVMGRHTFELAKTFPEWPYGSTPLVVLASRPVDVPAAIGGSVSVSSEAPAELVARLAGEGKKHAYVDGGVTIQRFLAAGLIDELIVTLIPVLLGKGRPLFGPLGRDQRLSLAGSKVYGSGFVQLQYRPAREA